MKTTRKILHQKQENEKKNRDLDSYLKLNIALKNNFTEKIILQRTHIFHELKTYSLEDTFQLLIFLKLRVFAYIKWNRIMDFYLMFSCYFLLLFVHCYGTLFVYAMKKKSII